MSGTFSPSAAIAALFCVTLLAADSDAVRLAQRAAGETPLAQDLHELCDRIGGRPTGSEANTRSVEWAVQKFRDAGIESVHTEPFNVPGLWLAESAEASVIAPAKFPVRIAAVWATDTTATVIWGLY